jgi:peroxiredoxin
MLQAGDPFPDFFLPNQDGHVVKLSDFAGKWLVVYFYPKDDTPGCTIEASPSPPQRPTSRRRASRSSA